MRQGDIDGNDKVDLSDFALFARCFGLRATDNAIGCSAQSRAASDLNGDKEVDLGDFWIFVERFGN